MRWPKLYYEDTPSHAKKKFKLSKLFRIKK